MMRGAPVALSLAAAGLFSLTLPTFASAQDVVLELPLPAAPKAVAVQVPSSGGLVSLTLVRTGTTVATTVTIAVTPFLSDAGERLTPLLSIDAAPKSGGPEVTLDARTRQFLSATMVVPTLPGLGPFTGTLFVVPDNGTPARQVIAISAANPSRPATLQIVPDTQTRVHPIHVPFFRARYSPPDMLDPGLGPTFDLRLSDAASRWPVQSVDTGPATATKAPDTFAFGDHAAFYDERGARLHLPLQTPVPATGRTVRLQLGGLTAGEYNITVPFFAGNAGGEPRKVTLIVYARHHVTWAVICLIVALLASYWASKLVSVRNARVRLLDRINDLRPAWLQTEPQSLAVAWIQSIVDQARSLSETRLLPSLDTIHERLDTAEALLRALDRLRRMRLEIRQSALPRLARARALKVAERLADRLDPEMSQAELAELTAAIADLRGWTKQGEVETRYAADLSGSITQLLTEVKAEAIKPEQREALVELVTELKTPLPTSAADLEERERRYAMLKILWERREAAEFEQLLPLIPLGIDQVFRKADESAWTRVTAQGDRLRIELVSHRNGLTPEAYDPLTFHLTTGDPALDATFLVMHGLTYEWTFTVKGKKESMPLTTSTHTPYVPLFAPFAGTMTPAVTLIDSRGTAKGAGTAITVARSRRFGAVNGFSTGEVLQLILAFVVAVITGLQTFYYKTASFGSLADYMALFAWGATIDQVKNFLQRLPSAPSTPSVLAGPAAPPVVPAAPAALVQAAPHAAAAANPAVAAPAAPAAPVAPQIPEPERPTALPVAKP